MDRLPTCGYADPRKGAAPRTELLSLDTGQIQGFNHLDHGDRFDVDKKVSDASAGDYDGLMIPGGVANGDFLRADADACAFTAAIAKARKPIAAICHAPWILVETGAFNAKMIEEFCEGPHDDAPQPEGRFAKEGSTA